MTQIWSTLGALLLCCSVMPAQIKITDSGSTNSPGMSVTIDNAGPQATIEPKRGGTKADMTLDQELCNRLMDDLKAAGPLNELPAKHCMKSVSFGKSVFIEYNGVRSPDLSCQQSDSRALALQKDVNEILSVAHTAMKPRPL